MATFSTYDAPANVTGAVGGRRASAADFGPDVSSAGAGLQQLAETLRVREDKRSITQARVGLNDFEVAFTADAQRIASEAPEGAPNLPADTLAEFDSRMADFNAGLNNIQKDSVGPRQGVLRAAFAKSALETQAASVVRLDIRNVGKLQIFHGQRVYGGLDPREAMAEFAADLSDTTSSAELTAATLEAAEPVFIDQYLAGMTVRPEVGIEALDSGMLDWVPADRRDTFRKALEDRQDHLEARAARTGTPAILARVEGDVTTWLGETLPGLKVDAAADGEGYPEQVAQSLDEMFAKTTEGMSEMELARVQPTLTQRRRELMAIAEAHATTLATAATARDVDRVERALLDRAATGQTPPEEVKAEYAMMLAADKKLSDGERAKKSAAFEGKLRSALISGIESRPDARQSLIDLNNGKYNSALTQSERDELRPKLVAKVVKQDKVQKTEDLASWIINSGDAADRVFAGRIDARELQSMFEDPADPVLTSLLKTLRQQTTPLRTPEQIAVREGEIFNMYSELGVSRDNGQYKTEEGLRKLADFYEFATQSVADGFASRAGTQSYLNRVRALMPSALEAQGGTGWLGEHTFEDTPFDHLVSQVRSQVTVAGSQTAVVVRVNTQLREAEAAGTPIDPQTIGDLVDQAWRAELADHGYIIPPDKPIPTGSIRATDGRLIHTNAVGGQVKPQQPKTIDEVSVGTVVYKNGDPFVKTLDNNGEVKFVYLTPEQAAKRRGENPNEPPLVPTDAPVENTNEPPRKPVDVEPKTEDPWLIDPESGA